MTDSIEAAARGLGDALSGRISLPGDDRFAAATSIWAKQSDVAPHAVVHCRSAADVQAAIRIARERNLPLSVRGGGHDWAGRALCNGIVLDLSGMRDVALGADHRSVTVAGGARAGDVTAITDPLGLAVVAGSASGVGMAGLTLGGGYGPLIGRFGLALDNALGADLVLADGRLVHADSENHADLFWALRGGGGNFGVVTAMRHRVHALPNVHAGLLLYPFAEATTVLDRCIALMDAAPDQLTVQCGFAANPGGTVMVMVVPTWSGRADEGEKRLQPFLNLGTRLAGAIETRSYGALLGMFDPFIVSGLQVVMESCWLPALDRNATGVLVQAMENAVSPGCMIVTHDFKGAASRVAANETAFGLRRDHVLVEVMATFPDRSDPADRPRHAQWARDTRERLTAAFPGSYPNLLASDDVDRAALSYGGNAERLMEVKRRYDPDNVFRSAIPLPRPARP